MRVKFLSLFAALLLVAGCQQKPEMMAESEGEGMTMEVGMTDMAGPGDAMDSEAYLVKNIGNRVFFDFDKYNISEPSAVAMERQAEWLKANPHILITIEGNCDERGTREYNLALGERRANAAKEFLVALGIDSNRIATVSFGKEKPIVLGSTESAWAQNRNATTILN